MPGRPRSWQTAQQTFRRRCRAKRRAAFQIPSGLRKSGPVRSCPRGRGAPKRLRAVPRSRTPRLSNETTHLRAPAASPRLQLRQCLPRAAFFSDQASLTSRIPAPSKTLRKSRDPSRARECLPRRRTGIALHKQARSP